MLNVIGCCISKAKVSKWIVNFIWNEKNKIKKMCIDSIHWAAIIILLIFSLFVLNGCKGDKVEKAGREWAEI
jgi:hypothetical protein